MKQKLWNNLKEELKDNIFNQNILKIFINYFYETVVKDLEDNKHILFIFRVVLINSDIKTVTKLLKINNELSPKNIISFLLDAINLTLNSYSNAPIKTLIISYGIRKGKIVPTITSKEEIKSQHIYYNHKLPIAINVEDYGDILEKIGDTTIISLKKNINLVIKSEDSNNYVKYFKNGKLQYEWTDHIKEDKSLIREIGKTTLFWKDGEIIWTKVMKNSKPIDKKRVSPNLKENFLTMDIETISSSMVGKPGEILNPYLISIYDGKKGKSYSYFIESGNIKNMIYQAMKAICIRKYKGYKIYLHNFSKFDSIFLIKYLIMIGKCDPIIHKGKIISFKFRPNWIKDFSITIYDSYLLLNSSLNKLSKSFSIEDPKGIFPFLLNDISYKGEVPSSKYFLGVNDLNYLKYKERFINKIWNFKEEAEKYCTNDCIALYQILSKFSKLIYSKFHLNIQDFPTLPSLAFAIYRSNYLKNEEKGLQLGIHQLSGDIDKDIRQGYTGGSTEMFIPRPPKGVKIHVYDVNSLYPFVMTKFKYPVGAPIYFEGNILRDNPNAFGFFYCKIKAPDSLLHPILQIHHKTLEGIRTISPLGSFEGMYFSQELYNAEKFGYKFEILRGYLFDSDYIFKDYVNDLYNLRLQYQKSDPMNYTAKILLNSLYGRFGMNDAFNSLDIVSQKELKAIESSHLNVKEVIEIPTSTKAGSKYLITFSNPDKEIITKMDGNKEIHNISIAVASAVTAYARIHMSQFKNNPLLPNLYYTDTDSAYFDGPLPLEFISPTELGKMKLEGIYDQALFLAPKVYALKNEKEEIIKIKGLTKESILKNGVTLDSLETLLNKDYKIAYNQRKWFRNISAANISILEQSYNLKVTGNKRELIYNDKDVLVATKPIIL